ncbi:hypothetical protein KM043_017408 [Ampulex compressa]|nr:hypothetical protein KM043_017408 [Ampulex compressa]
MRAYGACAVDFVAEEKAVIGMWRLNRVLEESTKTIAFPARFSASLPLVCLSHPRNVSRYRERRDEFERNFGRGRGRRHFRLRCPTTLDTKDRPGIRESSLDWKCPRCSTGFRFVVSKRRDEGEEGE